VDVVFLDANVLFSAAYRPEARVRQLWELQDVVLVTSAYTVEEARRNLEDPQRRTELERLLQKVKVETVAPVNRSLLPAINLPDKDLPVLLAAPVAAPSVSALLQRFRQEVAEHLRIRGIVMKGTA
jgi:uncharacterized protein